VAAHWQYKEGGGAQANEQRRIEWARRMLAPGAQEYEDRDLLESVRSQLFEDRVYALTPKGAVIELERGATPLDFAYHVHTDLGHRCRGARVNGRIVPLTTELGNGEVVEIITGRQAGPSRDWLTPSAGYLKSARSRAKVRAWFRAQDSQGRSPAEPAADAAPAPAPAAKRVRKPRTVRRRTSPVDIEGVGELPITLARCCSPIRPQPVTGYVTLGRGVTVHRADCRNLLRMVALKPDRILQVHWTRDAEDLLSVELAITARDRRGLVRDVADAIALERLSLEAMSRATDRATGTAHLKLTLAVHDEARLTQLLRRLSAVPAVIHARRTG
jgi:GTP pyrophosphokinase